MGSFRTVARIHFAMVLLSAVGALVFLRRTRFWFPRYVHWLAAISFAIGLALFEWVPADAPVNQGASSAVKRALIVLFFPAVVYGAFVIYGGQRAAYQARYRAPACPHCGATGGLPGEPCVRCGQMIPPHPSAR